MDIPVLLDLQGSAEIMRIEAMNCAEDSAGWYLDANGFTKVLRLPGGLPAMGAMKLLPGGIIEFGGRRFGPPSVTTDQ